jgi:rubredoxin
LFGGGESKRGAKHPERAIIKFVTKVHLSLSQVSAAMSSAPQEPIETTSTSTPISTITEPIAEALRDRHECSNCGYVYVPMQGDTRNGVAASTVFTDLPEKWRCPTCSAGKGRFQNIGPKGTAGFKQNANYGFGINTMDPGRKNLLIFGTLFVFFLFFLSLYGLE